MSHDHDGEEEEESETYTMDAGAGWMHASAEGDTPEEAYEYWEKMVDKLIEDLDNMDVEERNQVGLQ